MPKKGSAPDEAIGPVLDGTAWPPPPPPAPEPLPRPEAEEKIEAEPEDAGGVEHPVALICGSALAAAETGRLAQSCGFLLEFALLEGERAPDFVSESQIVRLRDYDNFVYDCLVGRDHFVCVFCPDEGDCVNILRQCLDSEAAYLGVFADDKFKEEVFSRLRELGAPDAELAAIACPMGLNIGARAPEQAAVAVVAQLLATLNGTTKRLTRD